MKITEKLQKFIQNEEYDYEETELMDAEEEAESGILKQLPSKKRGTMMGTLPGMKGKPGEEIMVRELFEFQDVMDVSKALRAGIPVFCNMQRCENEIIRRIVDFLSGAVVILEGDIQRIGDSLFFVTPHGVTINGEYEADFEKAKRVRSESREKTKDNGALNNLRKDNQLI